MPAVFANDVSHTPHITDTWLLEPVNGSASQCTALPSRGGGRHACAGVRNRQPEPDALVHLLHSLAWQAYKQPTHVFISP